MGFFQTLRNALVGDKTAGAGVGQSSDDVACAFDRTEWRKKLQRVLDGLPETQAEWDTVVSEARALKLDPKWVAHCQREEFNFMMRRAVSDRVVSEPEHHKLDLARELFGMPEPEAEAELHAIVSEAESIFGKPVRDET